MQPIECGYDLLKGAIDPAPRLVNVSFDFVQFQLVCFHRLYPIGNHVAQRIQAFSEDGKRGYLHSLRQEITAAKEKQGLEPIRYGRTYRNRQAAPVESRNREERSRTKNARNPGKEFRDISAATVEQSLKRHSFPLRCQIFKSQRVCRNRVAQGINPKRRRFAATGTLEAISPQQSANPGLL